MYRLLRFISVVNFHWSPHRSRYQAESIRTRLLTASRIARSTLYEAVRNRRCGPRPGRIGRSFGRPHHGSIQAQLGAMTDVIKLLAVPGGIVISSLRI